METSEIITDVELEKADQAAVHEFVATGKPLDPEVCRRVRARAGVITERLRATYGERSNISADLVREIRDEE